MASSAGYARSIVHAASSRRTRHELTFQLGHSVGPITRDNRFSSCRAGNQALGSASRPRKASSYSSDARSDAHAAARARLLRSQPSGRALNVLTHAVDLIVIPICSEMCWSRRKTYQETGLTSESAAACAQDRLRVLTFSQSSALKSPSKLLCCPNDRSQPSQAPVPPQEPVLAERFLPNADKLPPGTH